MRSETSAIKIILLFAFLLFVTTCTAQTTYPDTPAGNQAKGLMEAFNAGDAAKYKEFLTRNYPDRLQNADRDMGFREMTGGFDLKQIEESTPTKVVALVQERASDQFARLTVEVQPDGQHQITQFGAMAIPRPAAFALPHLSEAEIITAMRTKLDEELAVQQLRLSSAWCVDRES